LIGAPGMPRSVLAGVVQDGRTRRGEPHRPRRFRRRRITAHMIGETARHAGHGDILREQIDGATVL
jgi:Protein of unknown function (DUF664)